MVIQKFLLLFFLATTAQLADIGIWKETEEMEYSSSLVEMQTGIIDVYPKAANVKAKINIDDSLELEVIDDRGTIVHVGDPEPFRWYRVGPLSPGTYTFRVVTGSGETEQVTVGIY